MIKEVLFERYQIEVSAVCYKPLVSGNVREGLNLRTTMG